MHEVYLISLRGRRSSFIEGEAEGWEGREEERGEGTRERGKGEEEGVTLFWNIRDRPRTESLIEIGGAER